jgi:hypothetical protein
MKKFAIAAALAVLASTATAGILDGQTVRVEYLYPDASTIYPGNGNGNYVVGGGVEVQNLLYSNIFDVDLQSNGLTVIFNNNLGTFTGAAFNGFRVTDINNTIGAFTSFNLVSNTAGFNPVLTFDADNLYVNWQGINMTPGQIELSISAVPEPETFAMMLAGLGLLGAAARRRKQKQAA